jgi:hypothetical protein
MPSDVTPPPARAIVCSGHMIDAPDRALPRFPPDKEHRVRVAIERVLDELHAGANDIGISGAARGADLLFAEAMLQRAVPMKLLIALPEEEFIRRSVALPGTDWERRYRRVRERCEAHFQHEEWAGRHPDIDVFSRNNLWCIDTATRYATPSRIHAVLVWDGKDHGDGPGGTADFAARIKTLGGRATVIDPARV